MSVAAGAHRSVILFPRPEFEAGFNSKQRPHIREPGYLSPSRGLNYWAPHAVATQRYASAPRYWVSFTEIATFPVESINLVSLSFCTA